MAERVGELQEENLSQSEKLLVLREDKATALDLVNKLEAAVQEKSEELEQAVAELEEYLGSGCARARTAHRRMALFKMKTTQCFLLKIQK